MTRRAGSCVQRTRISAAMNFAVGAATTIALPEFGAARSGG